ncbi:hypothetical protein ACFLSF_04550 [Candidatus Bipolaricaulota bacterium]
MMRQEDVYRVLIVRTGVEKDCSQGFSSGLSALASLIAQRIREESETNQVQVIPELACVEGETYNE